MGFASDILIVKSFAWSEREAAVRALNANKFLRKARADVPDLVDDALATAMVRVIEHAASLVANIDNEPGDLRERTCHRLIKEALREAGRLSRNSARQTSLDAPLPGDEEQELTLGAFVVYDRITNADAETHCDAMKVARLAARLSEKDQAIFMMAAEGLTAEQIAKELGVHPGIARKERARVTALIGESFIWGAS